MNSLQMTVMASLTLIASCCAANDAFDRTPDQIMSGNAQAAQEATALRQALDINRRLLAMLHEQERRLATTDHLLRLALAARSDQPLGDPLPVLIVNP